MNETAIRKVEQKKLDSLSAKHLHLKELTKLNKLNKAVDFLALGVPVGYFAVRVLAKGTQYQTQAETTWEILAGFLLVLAIFKLIYQWQSKAEKHIRLMGDNISIVGLADNLLANPKDIPKQLSLFYVLTQKSEEEDRTLLGELKPNVRQWAYREALMEFGGNCPNCLSSPWEFSMGSCQLCGNTPKLTDKGNSE